MLAARGISVTHEAIRQWGLKFGGHSPTASASEHLAVATNGTWIADPDDGSEL
jgi:hypothetical protein